MTRTKLEQELAKAIADNSPTWPDPDAVKAAAEVAKRYIEKAFSAGLERGVFIRDAEEDGYAPQHDIHPPLKKVEWLKENGII